MEEQQQNRQRLEEKKKQQGLQKQSKNQEQQKQQKRTEQYCCSIPKGPKKWLYGLYRCIIVFHNNHDSSSEKKAKYKFQKEGKNDFGISKIAKEIVMYNSKYLLHISSPDPCL